MKRMFIAAILLVVVTHAYAQGKLKVGDKAPPLTIVKWLKGRPLTSYEKNKLYAIEFSGTWCPPCRKAIPHLTDMQKKYGDKIPIVSVYFEHNNVDDTLDLSYVNNVKHLMDAMGPKMDYAVAVDDPRQTTKKDWKLDGVPFVFIVQSGEIIWIGSPNDTEPVFEKLVNGSFNTMTALAQQEAYDRKFHEIWESNDYQASIRGIDSLIDVRPEIRAHLYYTKFKILAKNDINKAYQMLQWIVDNNLAGFDWQHFIGDFRIIPPGRRNYLLELKAIDRTIEESESRFHTAYPLGVKAETYAAMDNYAEAVKWAEKAVEYSKAPGAVARYTKEHENKLLIYRYKLKAKNNTTKAGTWLRTMIAKQQAKVSMHLIKVLMEEKQYDLALEMIDKAQQHRDEDLWKYISLPDGQLLAGKADAWAAKGDHKQAVLYYEQALQVSKKARWPAFISQYEKKLEELKTQQR